MKKNNKEYNIITIEHLRKNSNINRSKNNNRYSIKSIKSPNYNIDSKEIEEIIKANPFSPLTNNFSPLKTNNTPSEELYLFKLKNTPSSQNSQILYYDNLYFNKQNFDMNNNNYNQIRNKRFFSPLNNFKSYHSLKYYSPTFATSPIDTNNNILTVNNTNNQNNIIYTNSTNNDNVNYYSITTNDNNNINNFNNIYNNINNIYNNNINDINNNINNNNINIYNNNNNINNNNIYNTNNVESMNIMISEEYNSNNNNENINNINNYQNNPPYNEKLFNDYATYIQKMYRGYSLRKNMYSSIQYFVNFQNAFISLENLFYYKLITYSWNLFKNYFYKPKFIYDFINTKRPLTISIENNKNHPIRNSLNKFSFNINNLNDNNNIKIKSIDNINKNKNMKISSLNNFSLLNSEQKENIKKLKEENSKLLKNYYEILIDKDVFIAQVKNLKLILKDITKGYYEIKEEYEKEIKNYKLKCKELINKENELNKKFTLKNNTKEYEKLDKLYKDLKREYMFLKKDFNSMEDELNDVYHENEDLKKKVNDNNNNEIKKENDELRKKIFKLFNIKLNDNNNNIDILIKNKILKQFFILYVKKEEKTLDYNFKRFKNQTINNKKFINDKIKNMLIKNLMKNKINKNKKILSEYFNKLKINNNNNKIILDPEKPNKFVDPILYRKKQLRDIFYNKINQMKNYVHKKFSQFYYKGLLNQMKYGNLSENLSSNNNNKEINNNNNKEINNENLIENNENEIRNKAKTLKQLLIEKKKAQKSLLKSSFYKFYLKGIIKYLKNTQILNSPIKEEEKINFDDNTSSHTKNLPLSENINTHEKVNSNLIFDNSETTSINNNNYNSNNNIKQIEKEKLLEFLLYKKERNINMILKNKIIMWNLRAKIFKRDEVINKKKKKKKKNENNDKLKSSKPFKFSFNINDSDEEEEIEEDEDYEIIDIKDEIQKYFALNKCSIYFKNKILKNSLNKWKKNINFNNNNNLMFNLNLFNHLVKNYLNKFENCNEIIKNVVNKKFKKLFLKKLSNN